jgi:hypothetical protein
MRTIAVDFDATVHSYNGFDGDDPKGVPLPGAREGIRELMKDCNVVIFTARKPEFVRRWLEKYGFPPLMVTNEKSPRFSIILDDRGLNFGGNWETAVRQIKSFKPWWQTGQDPDEGG